jgi:Protein of unknown function (DUF3537)
MCLLGAARITHRAQRVVSIASKWHMSMSCHSNQKHITDATKDGGYISGYDHHVCPPLQHGSLAADSMQSFAKEAASASSVRQALGMHVF